MTIDLSTDLGYVRLLISDAGPDPLFSDDEIQAALTRMRSTKRAAAELLLIIAQNELLLAKKIQTQDLTTDGPAVADALQKLAADYRAQADRPGGEDHDPASASLWVPTYLKGDEYRW